MAGCKVGGSIIPERLNKALYEVIQELGRKKWFIWEHVEELRE